MMGERIWFKSRTVLRAALLLAMLCFVQAPSGAQSGRVVGLELVLLIDVSASVNTEEFRLQAHGLASAFRSDAVRRAISNSPGGLAVTVIQWADGANQKISIDWTLVENETDASWISSQLASMPRLIQGGHTALGDALAVALSELETNAYEGLRRVIDLSGDGRTNDGRSLRGARTAVLERGVTINGLAILNELPLLESYFRDHLIGGEGAFVLTASDYVDFTRAITEKLEREIQSMPVTDNRGPPSVRFAMEHPE